MNRRMGSRGTLCEPRDCPSRVGGAGVFPSLCCRFFSLLCVVVFFPGRFFFLVLSFLCRFSFPLSVLSFLFPSLCVVVSFPLSLCCCFFPSLSVLLFLSHSLCVGFSLCVRITRPTSFILGARFFLDPEIQRLLKFLCPVLERVIEQIDDMPVPQILKEIVELSFFLDGCNSGSSSRGGCAHSTG